MRNFIEKIASLDNIHQWEERDSVIKESVSQHSFKVAAICTFILERINKQTPDFIKFKLDCVEYSILHDFDESILGRDLSHTLKYNAYNGLKLREVLDNFVSHEIDKFGFTKLFDKFDGNVKLFCKLCDWIAMLTFVKRNEKMGVKTFTEEKNYCYENIDIKAIQVGEMVKDKFGINNLKELIDFLTEKI